MTRFQEEMVTIERICGPLWDKISPPDNPTTDFPKPFVMALTGNEAGAWIKTNANVPSRSEESIYNRLIEAQKGGRPFGSIKASMLAGCTDSVIRDYASSWGLTQIMGYNVLPWVGWTLMDIQTPETHYKGTIRLLAEFERDFMLDPEKDFAEFFRCWNAGNPHGKTYDPNYVQNGLDRMTAYLAL